MVVASPSGMEVLSKSIARRSIRHHHVKFMKNKSRIIKEPITWEQMDGNNELEKKLNCYLTKQFVMPSNIPSDECLNEAKHIIILVSSYINNFLIKKDS